MRRVYLYSSPVSLFFRAEDIGTEGTSKRVRSELLKGTSVEAAKIHRNAIKPTAGY